MQTYVNLFLKDLAATKYFAPIFIFIGNTLCSFLILTPLKALQKVIFDNTWMGSTNPFENVFDITFVGMFFVLLSFLLLNFQQRWSTTNKKSDHQKTANYIQVHLLVCFC
jgi:dipeptide/tripeptide permease